MVMGFTLGMDTIRHNVNLSILKGSARFLRVRLLLPGDVNPGKRCDTLQHFLRQSFALAILLIDKWVITVKITNLDGVCLVKIFLLI